MGLPIHHYPTLRMALRHHSVVDKSGNRHKIVEQLLSNNRSVSI
jgi:hypothetical protein